MSNGTTALNWSIGGYIGIKIFGYSSIIAADPSLRILFVLAPASLLVWQSILLFRRFAQQDGGETKQPFYERIEAGDWWRVFWILLIGHRPLASNYLLGFYVFSTFKKGSKAVQKLGVTFVFLEDSWKLQQERANTAETIRCFAVDVSPSTDGSYSLIGTDTVKIGGCNGNTEDEHSNWLGNRGTDLLFDLRVRKPDVRQPAAGRQSIATGRVAAG